MESSSAQHRQLIYLQPSSGSEALRQSTARSGWSVEIAADAGEVHRYISGTACNVGIAHVDELIARSYAEAEELFSTTHGLDCAGAAGCDLLQRCLQVGHAVLCPTYPLKKWISWFRSLHFMTTDAPPLSL